MCLSGPCLTISKDSPVIPFKDTLNDRKGRLFEDGFLLAGGLEHHVEGVDFGRLVSFRTLDNHLTPLGNNLDNLLVAFFTFVLGEGSASKGYLDALGIVTLRVLFHRLKIVIMKFQNRSL